MSSKDDELPVWFKTLKKTLKSKEAKEGELNECGKG